MDDMHISGNEPSSVILGQKSSIKVEKSDPKVSKQADSCIDTRR